MGNPLVELQRLGQSPWHDNIRRSQLTSGTLKRRVEAGDITGLTSNPTIFEQAIGGSADYDEALGRLARDGKTAEQIFDVLAIEDIRAAAALFQPVYERTRGDDGYVSIEVSPKLARDTARTIAEATRLWAAVDKPNLLVKIPATVEGLPAIAHCIAEGINVNVTLIFALERYDAVMDAYVLGLERRAKAGKDLSRTFSVASFFVSRVDTAVDRILEERIKSVSADRGRIERLFGQAAIANAKLAYQAWRRKFDGPRFTDLAARAARRQKPLWASTSTKNPRYLDVYYVEALVGPHTVDTMPPATIDAYRDHGRPEVRIDRDVDAARRTIDELASFDIRMDAVTRRLEDEGVAAFAKSYDSLIEVVERRRREVLGG